MFSAVIALYIPTAAVFAMPQSNTRPAILYPIEASA
ncbi:MAG: hypothetical protein ACJAXM_000381 [Arenicella sp.]|jgi:hypothetical protein